MKILLLPQPKILLRTVKSICGDAIPTELFEENSLLSTDLVYASVNKRANRNTNAASGPGEVKRVEENVTELRDRYIVKKKVCILCTYHENAVYARIGVEVVEQNI